MAFEERGLPIRNSEDSVHLQCDFPCSKEVLWSSWADSERVARWFGSDPDGVVISAEVDLRNGGSFSVTFQNSNGDRYTCCGDYSNIDEYNSFESTWYWKGREPAVERIRVELEATSGGSRMHFTHLDIDPETTHGYFEGWTSTFQKLGRLLK